MEYLNGYRIFMTKIISERITIAKSSVEIFGRESQTVSIVDIGYSSNILG